MKQTAVEWLETQIIKFHNWKRNPIYDENCFDEIELSKSINQAKEMEKQQIIDAYNNVSYDCGMQCLSEETCNENINYKITIPKEEPKQETLEELKKWREEALIAREINQKVIKKLMDEKSEQIDSEKKIDKILRKLEEIKIMINLK